MSLIEAPIHRPVSVIVGAIFIALFGAIAAFRLPVQLTPNVDRPIVTITTLWEGASPQEMEREIVDEQEDKLKGIEGLYRMTSSSTRGRGVVTLEFSIGIDISRALLDVSEKLRQVPAYPLNVDEPVISSGDTEGANAIAWVVLQRTSDSPIAEDDLPRLETLMKEDVKPRLERAKGIASVEIFGGVEREVHVLLDPARLASRNLTLLDVRNAIRGRNTDISAGDIHEGKHALAVRAMGRFENLREIEELVLARRGGQIVLLRDVAQAAFGYKKPLAVVRSLGAPSIALSAARQSGTNVIQVMKEYKKALESANRQVLEPKGLRLVQVYDQTDYIYSSVDLVLTNLYVGGALAVAVLLLFLKEARSTFIIALAIPLSVVGSFIGLAALGRNLNVVSLAGLSFAVGMVVDNSIVVLENIYRHRHEGKSAFRAAVDGTREVWGAVLASTLTTLAVFVPVIFMQEEAGQLFRDISIAISASILLSLLVSVFFVPAIAARLLAPSAESMGGRWLHGLFGLDRVARGFTDLVAGFVAWLQRGLLRRIALASAVTGASIALSSWMLPPTSYLPGGNQNLVIGFLVPPPGYSTDEFARIARRIESKLAPYWEADIAGRPLGPELAHPSWYQGKEPIPAIRNFFFVAFGSAAFMGAASVDAENVKPLEDLISAAGADIPGSFTFASQTSLFEHGISSGNSIDLEISGDDYEKIRGAAGALLMAVMQDPLLGPRPPRPEPPNFNLGAPEVRLSLDEAEASSLGLSNAELGFVAQCMVDGAVVSDFRDRGFTIDLKLLAAVGTVESSADLEQIPIHTPSGRQVTLASVARVTRESAPGEIRRLEKKRSVKLVVSPPPGVELSLTMEALTDRILPSLRASGAIAEDVETTLAGTASKLVSTRESLQVNLLLAVLICYLLMAALFESFVYPLVVILSVPLAGVGGILALRAVHEATGQQMDVLTMLGFIILVGTVVNNAILIVHQALLGMREQGLSPSEAVTLAVRTRMRPIFMTTLTSVFGMLPLVIAPGAGSELYRGLGSVVVGGLVSSTAFTLVLIPTVFTLALDAGEACRRILGRGKARTARVGLDDSEAEGATRPQVEGPTPASPGLPLEGAVPRSDVDDFDSAHRYWRDAATTGPDSPPEDAAREILEDSGKD